MDSFEGFWAGKWHDPTHISAELLWLLCVDGGGGEASEEAVAAVQMSDHVCLGQGSSWWMMTHFDTESEFWHGFLQTVTLDKLFSFSELQFLLRKPGVRTLPFCNHSGHCRLSVT